MHVHARLMMSNRSFKALVYALDCIPEFADTRMYVKNAHANLNYMHTNCKPRTTE